LVTAHLIDGKAEARKLQQDLRARIEQDVARGRRAPGLAVILVGDDPASEIYVRNKRRACAEVGMRSFSRDLPASITQAELLDLIDELNRNPEVDGILVQLPLPAHIDPSTIIDHIDPRKDVDGFHAYNIGRLAL